VLKILRLDGKTAIVTGAGRGPGKAMAKVLAQAGAEKDLSLMSARLCWPNSAVNWFQSDVWGNGGSWDLSVCFWHQRPRSISPARVSSLT